MFVAQGGFGPGIFQIPETFSLNMAMCYTAV